MSLYVDAVAPEGVTVTISRGTGSTFDFTTPTAAAFLVKKPNGSLVTWAATILAASTTSLTMGHDLIAGDVDLAGEYVLVPRLTVPAGFVKARKLALVVEDPFA